MKSLGLGSRPLAHALRNAAAVLSLAGLSMAAQAGVIFSQDFESGLGANEFTSGRFAINTSGFGNNGTKMMGTPNGYGNNESSSYLVSGIQLSGSDILLSFDFALSTESCCDILYVEASGTNTGGWVGLTTLFGSTTNSKTISLDSLAGQTVSLRFRFTSDFSVVGSGLNFDNIEVSASDPAGSVPEPTGLALVATALVAATGMRRRG